MSNLNKIRSTLVWCKNNNAFLNYLWSERRRKQYERRTIGMSDIEFVTKAYYVFCGRYPDLDTPSLFSEKMQWMKLFYRNPLMEQCADKFAVRSYVQEKGFGDILNELYVVYNTIDEIDIRALPNQFILKAAHASARNIICEDKNRMYWPLQKLLMKSWLKENIYYYGREWVYDKIPHRIVCEKYLQNPVGGLIDYKFFCFNGTPKFIQANMGRFGRMNVQNFYNLDWNIQPFGKDLIPHPEINVPRPKQLSRMIEIAAELAQPFSFVRVDFYEVEERIIFGELTFFPAGGMPDFKPAEYDEIVGEMLTLPAKNYVPDDNAVSI